MKIVIAGSTGLIGQAFLAEAINDPSIHEIHLVGRRKPTLEHEKIQFHLTYFNAEKPLPEDAFTGAHAVVVSVGTTRKKTPNLEAYKSIDLGIPLYLAGLAKAHKVVQFHLISAVGADANSKIFYNQLKGEIENQVKEFGFPQTYIYQPSLLIGKRSEHRWGELFAQKVFPCFDFMLNGKFKKYQSVKVELIAKSIIRKIHEDKLGVEVLDRQNF